MTGRGRVSAKGGHGLAPAGSPWRRGARWSWRRLAFLGIWAVVGGACHPALGGSVDDAAISEPTASDADIARALRRRGARQVERVLEGDLGHAEEAERTLRQAYALDPHDVTTARILGRFLNLRLARGDFSQAPLQRTIYAHLQQIEDDRAEAFAFGCFSEAALAAHTYAGGSRLRAWGHVRQLEHRLDAYLEEHPQDVASWAMAGNYAMELAARVPVGRRRRVRTAAERFSYQQEHWHEQPTTAQGHGTAPGTRAVFAFWLGELDSYRGEIAAAERAYRRVVAACSPAMDASVAACELAERARDRLGALGVYAGRAELIPAWPAGEVACIACHAWSAPIPGPGPFRLPVAEAFAAR